MNNKAKSSGYMETILQKDLPSQIQQEIKEEIKPYTVGLIGLKVENGAPRVQLLGSGTLIHNEERYGILTANHVVKRVKKYEKIGLNLVEYAHKYTIDVKILKLITVGASADNTLRPDIAVIEIPVNKVAEIKAKKSFWNLKKFRQQIISQPVQSDKGVWALAGSPDERTTQVYTNKHFAETKVFCMLVGFVGVGKEWSDESFDYIEALVSYKDNGGVPSDFGGVSGGGLWQTPLRKNQEERIVAERPILSGVAYYQTDVVDEERSIYCHGRNSIYSKVYEKLQYP